MSKESKEEGQTITLPDGRKLGYLSVGEGRPVFWFPGFPNSRLSALALSQIAAAKHLWIIGVDRPGFGLSTYAPKRAIRDFAADVSCLADHLDVAGFALVGYSTGGHYAVSCTALLPKRIKRTVVISGFTLPPDTSGMFPTVKGLYRFGTMPIVAARIQKRIRSMWLEADKDPDWFSQSKAGSNLLKSLPEADQKFMISAAHRPEGFRADVEAYRQGPDSIRAAIQQLKLQKRGWDVDLSQIPSGLVHLWHGTADVWAPVSNAYKNAKIIPGAHLKIFENEGHALLWDHLEEIGELLSV